MSTNNSQIYQFNKSKENKQEAHSSNSLPVKKDMFGVGVTNAQEEDVLEYIKKTIKKSDDNYYIVTPNPEILMYAQDHLVFKSVLNNARLALCDGVGILLAGRILGISYKQRITGVDFMKALCNRGRDWPITVGFLGGKGNVAETTAECLKQLYPGLRVVFIASEWDESKNATSSHNSKNDISQKLNSSDGKLTNREENGQPYRSKPSIDVLFIAFGFPKQEIWMAEHINKIPVRVMVSVGGSFDYLSGKVTRAPYWVRFIGFEWLFRLIRQPWRWRRQLSLIRFSLLVLKRKIIC